MIKVTAAIIIKDHKLLIARRKAGGHAGGKWELPGGKTEKSETPEECLARELFEEFSINVKVGAFFASSTYAYPHLKIELLAYHVTHESGDFVLRDHDEMAWATLADLDQYDFAEADLRIMDKIKKEIKF
jgi:8-oxo-dGTP diphosphatase